MLDDEAPRSELIAKLIRAGYLRPERPHDPDAVAGAIARMKEDLRSGGSGGRRKGRRDETRRPPANIAKLPDLIGR